MGPGIQINYSMWLPSWATKLIFRLWLPKGIVIHTYKYQIYVL